MSEAAHPVRPRAILDTVVLGRPTRGSMTAKVTLTVAAQDGPGDLRAVTGCDAAYLGHTQGGGPPCCSRQN